MVCLRRRPGRYWIGREKGGRGAAIPHSIIGIGLRLIGRGRGLGALWWILVTSYHFNTYSDELHTGAQWGDIAFIITWYFAVLHTMWPRLPTRPGTMSYLTSPPRKINFFPREEPRSPRFFNFLRPNIFPPSLIPILPLRKSLFLPSRTTYSENAITTSKRWAILHGQPTSPEFSRREFFIVALLKTNSLGKSRDGGGCSSFFTATLGGSIFEIVVHTKSAVAYA